MDQKDIDEISGVETTGHEWDGIKELNNPLPKWWLTILYMSIVFSLGYVIYYPAIPLINEATKGISGYSSRDAVEADIAANKAVQAPLVAKLAKLSLDEIKADPDLYRFAVSGGNSAFKVNCTPCHGSGAQGAPGYPNLNDDDWLWGGSLKNIHTSIAHGVRNEEDDDARVSEMPAFGEGEVLSPTEITATAHFVRKLAKLEFDSKLADAGAAIFAENCAACHGETGKGDKEQGAPNLTDAIWFYGDSLDDLVAQIHKPKHGVMPAWAGRLDSVTIKQLTLYVHSLGGGE